MSEERQFSTFEIDGHLFGVPVLEAPPDTLHGVARDLIDGVYKFDDRLLLSLDVHKAVLATNEAAWRT